MAHVHGKVSVNSKGQYGFRVDVFEKVITGYKIGAPCVKEEPKIRKIASLFSDFSGKYSTTYAPTIKPIGACSFNCLVYVQIYDGRSMIWKSKEQKSQEIIEINFSTEKDISPPDWNYFFIGLGTAINSHNPCVDLVWLGENRFAVMFGGRENHPILKVMDITEKNYSPDIIFPIEGHHDGYHWIKGNSGKPLAIQKNNYIEYVNFIVYNFLDNVYLVRLSYPHSLKYKLFTKGGRYPSIAWAETKNKGLIVWGKDGKVKGAFFNESGNMLGQIFDIVEMGEGDIRKTDVIWNSVSNQFIIGFLYLFQTNCNLYNLTLKEENNHPIISSPILRGGCDWETGGHWTAAAFDSHPSNTEGEYAWWLQGLNGKELRIYDANGNPTSSKSSSTGFQGDNTIPVCAVVKKFNNPIDTNYNYATIYRTEYNPNSLHSLYMWSVSKKTWDKIKELERRQGVFAIRSLLRDFVAVYINDLDNPYFYISVIPGPKSKIEIEIEDGDSIDQ